MECTVAASGVADSVYAGVGIDFRVDTYFHRMARVGIVLKLCALVHSCGHRFAWGFIQDV